MKQASEIFRENLHRFMTELKINQTALAKVSGIPQPTISNLLNGTTKEPELTTIDALARGLKVTVGLLLTDPKDLPKPLVRTIGADEFWKDFYSVIEALRTADLEALKEYVKKYKIPAE